MDIIKSSLKFLFKRTISFFELYLFIWFSIFLVEGTLNIFNFALLVFCVFILTTLIQLYLYGLGGEDKDEYI